VAVGFALGAALPLLILSIAFYHYGLLDRPEVPPLLAGCLGVCWAAYEVVRRRACRLAAAAQELSCLREGRPSSPERLEKMARLEEMDELGHMREVTGSFNELLGEFKESNRSLEDLIYKLSSLSELTELSSRISEADHMLQVVLQRTMAAVDATMGSVMLTQPDGKELRVAATQGHPGEIIGQVVALGEGIAGQVAKTGETIFVTDIETDERYQRKSDPKYGTGSFICMPLRVNGRTIGVINLARKANLAAFEEADLKFLRALFNHISFALEHTRLLREAKLVTERLESSVQDKVAALDMAQRQILQAEKLSALGDMAAGIVHELNSPLTGIIGYAEILHQSEHNPKRERHLQRILEEAQRASRIVSNLLSFARRCKPERSQHDLNAIVRDVLALRAHDLRLADVTVDFKPGPRLPQVLIDQNQIQQVLLNLLNNAQQAISQRLGGGRITIKTWAEKGKVFCSLQDNGVGIPPEHASWVFDPFYTTREHGQGTGLGLSVSYGIIREHHGQICFESEPGQGTTFFFELPALSEAARIEEEPEPTYQPASRLPIRRVLLVDDEQIIIDLVSELLEAQGYEVDTALSAKAAQAKLKGTDYDMVVCDVRMPGMDGADLYEQIRATRPELARRFLFSTGDVIGERTSEFLQKSGADWLRKPFTGEQLVEKLNMAWQRINAN
jgi:signal transduction histidine kinase/CheY-like chemotaxis protein